VAGVRSRQHPGVPVFLALEGFSTKTLKTPTATIRLAQRRLADWRNRAAR